MNLSDYKKQIMWGALIALTLALIIWGYNKYKKGKIPLLGGSSNDLDLDLMLSEGSNNPETGALQERLNNDGANLTVDNMFGPLTKEALVNEKGIEQTTLNQYDNIAQKSTSYKTDMQRSGFN